MPPNGLRAERRMLPVQGKFQILEFVSLQTIFSVYLDPLGRYDSPVLVRCLRFRERAKR
jgi:hypothetical protein